MKRLTVVVATFVAAVLLCPSAGAQAVAEYGISAGRVTTSTAVADGVGKGIKGAFGNVDKAIKAGRDAAAGSAPKSAGNTVTQATAKPSAQPAETEAAAADEIPAKPPAPVYEDPRQIQAGMDYDEMLRRFGPPSMSVTEEPGRSTLWYSSNGQNYPVQLQGKKVVSGPGAQRN
jgi:hypothetical protein